MSDLTTGQRIAREFATYNLSMREEVQAELVALIDRHLAEAPEPEPPTCPFCGYDEVLGIARHGYSPHIQHRSYCQQCGVSLSGWCATRDEALALHEQRAAEWAVSQEPWLQAAIAAVEPSPSTPPAEEWEKP